MSFRIVRKKERKEEAKTLEQLLGHLVFILKKHLKMPQTFEKLKMEKEETLTKFS